MSCGRKGSFRTDADEAREARIASKPRIRRALGLDEWWECFSFGGRMRGVGTTPRAAWVDYEINTRGDRS